MERIDDEDKPSSRLILQQAEERFKDNSSVLPSVKIRKAQFFSQQLEFESNL